MNEPRVYADFQKLGDDGCLILTARGSIRDLSALKEPKDGMRVVFYSDDANDLGEYGELEVEGELKFDSQRNIWVGIYDPNEFRHASERGDVLPP